MSPEDKTLDYAKAERFLLGNLTDDEAFDFKCKVFADEELSEQLDIVRNDLAEKYLNHELDDTRKSQFENYFLASPYHAQIFAFQESLIKEINERNVSTVPQPEEKQGLFSWVWDLFSAKNFAVPALTALVLLALGIGFIYTRKSEDVAGKTTPTPTVEKIPEPTPVITPTDNRENSNNSNAPANSPKNDNNLVPESNLNKPAPTPATTPKNNTQSPVVQVFATALISASSRNIGTKENPIVVGKITKTFDVDFPVPQENPQHPISKYKLILETINNQPVWEGSLAKEKATSEKRVKEAIPLTLLKTEHYRFRVVGVFEDGTSETVKSDTFYVKRVS